MKLPKKILLGVGVALAVLVAVAIAVPFLVSIDDYVPRIEQEISARLKEPVSISKIRLSMAPVPHVVVDGIKVGKAGDLTVGKVTLTPDLWSLLSATKVLRSVEITKLVMTQKALDKIPVWSKQDKSDQPPAVRVGSIRLDDAVVKLDAAVFGPFDGKVRLDDQGEPAEVSVRTQDGKLTALITPDPKKANYAISASAKGWKVPVGPPIVFDELEVQGIATLKDAVFSKINAKAYGGTANGTANLAWQKGLQLKGKFDVAQMELKNVVPLLSPGTNVSGRLNAKPVFSSSAPDAGQLMNALHLETPFDVQNGVLHGVDIQKAALNLVGKGGAGGETKFDRLAGHLVMDHGSFKFSQLNISSGVLAADGNVAISPKKELSGRMNAKVNVVSVALNVSGTVQSPMLMPTGGTVAGAAIGTVLLPGIGTGVGAKAGQMIEGLFGKKPAK
jgi:uncharacterized protein involved in outer membrane biogenesis